MSTSYERRRKVLLMYLDWAAKDLEFGRAISRRFAAELERWGRARTDRIDCRNAILLVPTVEAEGIVGDEKFAEVARRLERFKGKDPDERLIRKWWEKRKELGLRSLLSDDVLNRPAGRPKRKR